jgi:hypothetical protein
VQRLKFFVVVCISILFAGRALAQPTGGNVDKIIPNPLPVHLSSRLPNLLHDHPEWHPLPMALFSNPSGTALLIPVRTTLLASPGSVYLPLPGLAAPASMTAYPLYLPAMAAQMPLPPIRAVGGEYYTQQLGFFCKKELEFEKTTRIPLHFRLGDMQYVNHLEGK